MSVQAISDIEIEQRWYVQLAPGCTLVEMEIIEVTDLTVLMRNIDRRFSHPLRYRFDEVVFVEAC